MHENRAKNQLPCGSSTFLGGFCQIIRVIPGSPSKNTHVNGYKGSVFLQSALDIIFHSCRFFCAERRDLSGFVGEGIPREKLNRLEPPEGFSLVQRHAVPRLALPNCCSAQAEPSAGRVEFSSKDSKVTRQTQLD